MGFILFKDLFKNKTFQYTENHLIRFPRKLQAVKDILKYTRELTLGVKSLWLTNTPHITEIENILKNVGDRSIIIEDFGIVLPEAEFEKNKQDIQRRFYDLFMLFLLYHQKIKRITFYSLKEGDRNCSPYRVANLFDRVGNPTHTIPFSKPSQTTTAVRFSKGHPRFL